MSNTMILSFNCPKCGALLEATEDTLIVRCKYCKHEINIEHDNISFIHTASDKRLQTYEDMAYNSINVKDYENAEAYFRLICEMVPQEQNFLRYNICCFLNKSIPFNKEFVDTIDILTSEDTLFFLKTMKSAIVENMEADIAVASEFLTTTVVKNQKREEISARYKDSLDLINEHLGKCDDDNDSITETITKAVLKLPRIMIIGLCILIAILFFYLFIVKPVLF